MKKTIALVIVPALIMAFAAGCTTPTPTTEQSAATVPASTSAAAPEAPKKDTLEGMKIGATIIYKGDEWCYNLDQGLNKLAEENGAVINVQDGNLNPEAQMKQVENFIAEGVDFLFVDPVSPDSLVPVLEKAEAKGIPVILYDGYANWGKEITTVSWDNKETGTICGQYAKKYIEENLGGKANIVIITMAASERHQDRVDGFTEQIKDMPGVTIISTQDGEGNRERSANVMTNIKDKVDIVFGVDDNSAWGAITALEALNAEGTIVLSAGGYGAESFEALHSNNKYYKALVAVDPMLIASSVFDAANSYLKNTPVNKKVNIKLEAVTHDNVENYWTFN